MQDITLQHSSFLKQFISHLCQQYQQNQQSPIISTERIGHKKTTVYNVGNAFPSLGQAQTCGGFKSANGISTPPHPS